MSHYDTLGVPRNADAATIKRAYRRRSKESHPDRPGGDACAMVAVNRAYDTLSDPEKRARYDQTGEDVQPEKSKDDQARDAIMQIFMLALEKCSDYDNVIDMIERQLKGNIDKIQNDIATAEKRVTKLERSAKRLKCKRKDQSRNFLALLIADQVAKTRAGIENAKTAIAMLERARELLSDFSWQAEERPAAPPSVFFTTASVDALKSAFEETLKQFGATP